QELVQATQRITKKLGGVRTKKAVLAIQKGSLAEAAEVLLEYYDSAYRHALSKRQQPIKNYYGKQLSPEIESALSDFATSSEGESF
ncbi:MAG TPA: hypothetical protein VIH61_02710, partial [Waddliaceae bacterium]